MKRSFMKKALAVALSTALAFSVPMVSDLTTASAAKKFVALNTTKKTLKVGQKKELSLKNNNLSWKIKKVVVSDKSVVKAYNKTKTTVMLKGRAEGKATVTLKLKTAKRKKNNTKNLKCKVTVKPAAATPDTPTPDPTPITPDPTPAPTTTATVATQAELDAALANPDLQKLTINSQETSLTIGENNYPNVDLIVNAPKADITNSATFKSITIQAISESTWKECGKNNKFTLMAPKARLVVESGAVVSGIMVATANAAIALEVNGTVNAVTVSAKITLSITGTTTVAVPVVLDAAAKGAEVMTAAPMAVTAKTTVKITLEKGAEASAITVNATVGEKVEVKNNSVKDVVVKNTNGSITQNQVVKKDGGNAFVNGIVLTTPAPGTSSGGNTSSGGDSSSGGSGSSGTTSDDNKPSDEKPKNKDTVNIDNIEIVPVPGVVEITSKGAISGSAVLVTLNLSNALTTVSKSAVEVEYAATLAGLDGIVYRGNGGSEPDGTGKVEIRLFSQDVNLEGEIKIHIVVKARARLTAEYSPGEWSEEKEFDVTAKIVHEQT